MKANSLCKSVRRTRFLLSAGTALPLAALAMPAHAQAIMEQSASDITVDAESASGTPVAVELSSTGGSVEAAVETVAGTAQAGVRDYIVGLETQTDGSITGTFGSITGTGEGELLGLGATTFDGDIVLDVGTLELDGTATAGIAARSTNGDIQIGADTVIARGTGQDSQFEFYEAVIGNSGTGSVIIDVGTAETFGTYASALVAIAGDVASVTAESATSHYENTVAVYASGANGAAVDIGTIIETSETGQGVYVTSAGGNASLTADTIAVGDLAQGARIHAAAGNVDIAVGSITGGRGIYVDPTAGDVSIAVDSIDTYGYAINAATNSGGDVSIDAGTVSSSIDSTSTVIANVLGGGALTIDVEEASGAGVEHSTIDVYTDTGDVAITGGSVTASGNAGIGVHARSTDGDVSVALESVATTGLEMVNNRVSEGILAESANGTVTVTVDSASAEGHAASAVVALGGAGATISAEEASVAGQFAAALYAYSNAGDAAVDAGTVTLRGDQQAAINAFAGGGAATVSVDNIVGEGTLGRGVYAEAAGGVSITSGTIDAQRYGITAIAFNGSDATVQTTGDTVATEDYGIYAEGANVSIATAEGSTTQGGTYGIRAVATDSATIANGGTAVATADLGSAIHVTAPGAVSIVSEAVQVTGAGAGPGVRSDGSGYRLEQGGIIVEGGDGAITIDAGTVDVEGEFRYGIIARGNGAIAITADEVNLASADSGAVIARGGAGDVSITTGTVTTTGASGAGVLGQSTTGDIAIDAGVTRVENEGLAGPFTGDAVVAISDSGTVSVTSDDAFSAGLYGSAVVGIGGEVSLESGRAETTGDGGLAVYGQAVTGNVTIDAAETVTSGNNTRAVYGRAHAGDVTLAIGSLTATGDNASGAFARADNGTASIVTTGDVAATGVALRGQGAAVSIETGEATTTSGSTGILVNSSGTAMVANGGTAVATADLGSAIHVTAPGAVSITSNAISVTGAGADPGVRADGSNMRLEQGGIVVEGGDGAITIDAGTVDVEGEFRYGITARGNGTIAISADEVNLASADAAAVVARGGAGDVSITTGTVTTTGASGAGVLGQSTTGDIAIDAGVTRVESEGMAGPFTGDAVVGISQTGAVSIVSDDSFTAGYGGSGVAGIGRDVTIVSTRAETTGDNGVAVYAVSNAADGSVSVDSETIVTSGSSAALYALAQQGSADVRVGDIAASADDATGILARSLNTTVILDGDVSTGGLAVSALGYVTAEVEVNGSVTSANGPAIFEAGPHGIVRVAEGASVTAAQAGVAVSGLSPTEPALFQIYNEGTVEGSAAVFVNVLPNTIAPNVVVRNDGVLVGTSGYAVVTAAGDDVLDLSNNSQVTGIADLGAGYDILDLDFNDDVTEGVGQVAATVNVEHMSVSSGSWLAAGAQSQYATVDIDEGSTLTIVENADGEIAIEAGAIALDGILNVDFSAEDSDGDFAATQITGAGSLHLVGTSTIVVEDASGLQHTGGTFIENGELLLTDVYGGDIATSGEGTFQLGDGGTTGAFTGDIVNDGTFVYARSDSYELAGSFTGTGSLVKNGDGTLTFGGLYDFTGTTTVNGGAIALSGQLAEDTELDLSGGGTFDLSQVEGGEQTIGELGGTGGTLALGGTDLTIDQSGDTSFGGSITGSGTLIKQGAGDLKLEGNSDFSGNANVNGGTLSVNGSFQNAGFVVNDGGTLGGNGTVGTTSIQGGTLGAGNSIGELTVAGDLTFAAGSTLEVEVDPAGNADLINVTGVATLGSAAVNVLAGPGIYAPETDYTILTADGGITGIFGAVNTNLAYLVPLLGYTVDTVTLQLTRNDVDYSTYAATANQAAIGNLIESLGFGTTLYDATLVMARGEVPGDFETLTGEIYPVLSASLIETADMLRRQTAQAPRQSAGAFIWGTALGGEIDGDAGSGAVGYEADNSGLAAGLGYAFGEVNVSIGLGKLWQGPDASQIGDTDVEFAMAEANWSAPAGLAVRAGAQFGWVDANASRNTTLGTIAASVSSAIEGDYTQLYGELGYSVPMGAVSVEPFAGISHVALDLDSFTEVGGPTALTVDGLDRDVTFADFGLRLAAMPVGGVSPYVSGAYRRAWGDRASTATVAFAGSAAGATISGLPIARGAAEVEAGVRYTGGLVTLDLGYNGSFSNTFDNNNVKLTASIRF